MGVRLRELILGLWLALSIVTGALAASAEEFADVEAFFDGVFAMQQIQYQVPGISVALVKDGELLVTKGYGYADLEAKQPVNPDTTLHRPGSNSKLLVWTAVMQLVEGGQLDLHRDINEYLDFTIPNQLHSGEKTEPITLHHLLTHTAGFEDQVTGLFVLDVNDLRPLDEYLASHIPALVYPPGTTMAYSNYGTSLAAYIVERVCGQPFYAYVHEHIFEPLEMTRSTFIQPLPAELAPHMSKGYHLKSGRHVAGEFELVQSYPAGSLTSSTTDMAKLMLAFLQLGTYGENQILAEETALLMQSQQYTKHPEIPGMAYGFIENIVNGHRILEHGGDTGLFHTGLYLMPHEGLGLYVSYNMVDTAPARRELLKAFMDRYFPQEEKPLDTPRPIPLGTYSNYVGTFYSTRSNFSAPETIARLAQSYRVSVDEDGFLILSTLGSSTRFGEISPGLFVELDGENKIALSFSDGRVSQIHTGGPHSLIRASWYETPEYVLMILLTAAVFMIITLLGWAVGLLRRSKTRHRFGLQKLLGSLFILGFFSLAMNLIGTLTDIHPDFGVPRTFFTEGGLSEGLMRLPTALGILASLMVAIMFVSWIRKAGSIWMRIHYTFLTLSAVSVVWLMWVFNFL